MLVANIRVKLSGGRTALVKLESSKPLIVNTDGSLVNIHDQNRDVVSYPPQKVAQVNTITLNPSLNLKDIQHNDPHLSYIIDKRKRKLPKPNLKQIEDHALKSWLSNYGQYFLHDEIVYRAIGNKSNSHPQHVILIPSGCRRRFLKH